MKKIQGTVVCSGMGSGIAVHVKGLEESRHLTGDFIIVDSMPPSKFILRYRKNLKGVIISEREYAKLSHSAVLLKEYKIPFVVLLSLIHI